MPAAPAYFFSSFPRNRRAVRGNSSIGQDELMLGKPIAGLAGWRLVDMSQRPPVEKPGSHQVGEAQREQARSAVAGGDAQQQIGDHCGDNLQPDGVFAATEKAADFEGAV